MDINSAPDETIKYTVDISERHKIKRTISATHKTSALEKLDTELFEVGIDPNYFLTQDIKEPVDEDRILQESYSGAKSVG
jgi:hypothetical protein